MSKKTKILHIINSLDQGGAEIMLAGLLEHTNQDRFDFEVISLTTFGPVTGRIRGLGIPVHAINLSFLTFPWALMKLFFLVWRAKPDVIQTWMYHSNFFGGLAGKTMTRAKIFWGLHASRLDPFNTKLGTILAIKACVSVAGWLPDRIICCSRSAQTFHESLGYDPSMITFIANGFDLSRFREDRGAKHELARELGINDDIAIIGMMARYHPNKDHRNFLIAASLLRERIPNVHFICCGKGVDDENTALSDCIEEFSISDCCTLMGERADIPYLAAAMDMAVSASFIGEAFPLVLGEAMACATPCVTTNVGDAAEIVGETGRVVSPRDPELLAEAMESILAIGPDGMRELGLQARKRILDNFHIRDITRQYHDQYESLLNAA